MCGVGGGGGGRGAGRGVGVDGEEFEKTKTALSSLEANQGSYASNDADLDTYLFSFKTDKSKHTCRHAHCMATLTQLRKRNIVGDAPRTYGDTGNIYIYICVCVCVCVYTNDVKNEMNDEK